ncbi:7739_t:CDS:2, partial [Dentiscutata erythropus]
EIEEESFQVKIDIYIKSLEYIIRNDQGKKRNKAQNLLDRYKKASENPTFIDNRPDYKLAREWEEKRSKKMRIPLINHHHHSTFTGIGTISGGSVAINCGTFGIEPSRKKNQEKIVRVAKFLNAFFNAFSGLELLIEYYKWDEMNTFFQTSTEYHSTNFFTGSKTLNTDCEKLPSSNLSTSRALKRKNDSDGEDNLHEESCDVEDEKPKIDKENYMVAFGKIPENSKMKLSSGRIVEDILFEYAKDKVYEDDQEVRSLFSMDEWAEITKEDQLEDFQVPDELANFMNSYNKSTLQDIRSDIMRSYLKEGEVYDPSLHYDKEWLHGSIRTIVNLWENRDAPLARMQYEDWYFGNILGQCLDFCFRDSTLGTDIKRTDAPSLASGNKKNRNKQKNHRKKVGRKIDGIIYNVEYNLELGAIESARTFKDEYDRKYLHESFKLPKVLRDIYCDLVRFIKYDEEKSNSIQVIGILHFGLRLQFVRLWRAGGSITIFKKSNVVYHLSSKFTRPGICDFLKLLAGIYAYKNNLRLLGLNEDKENDFLKELKKGGRESTPPPKTIKYLVDCWMTPVVLKPIKPKQTKRQNKKSTKKR